MSLIFREEYPLQVEVNVYPPNTHALEDQTSPQNRQSFTIQTRAVCENTIKDIIKETPPAEVDTTLCLHLITGWQQVLDENKQEMPFNQENLKKIVAHPFIRHAMLSAYWHALYESRLKN